MTRTTLQSLRAFLRDDDGAVTVDWVVLTAAITALGVSAAATMSSSVGTMSGRLETELTETTILDIEL